MPIFRYTGYDNAGAETGGTIEADGRRDAVLKIRSKGILPKEIDEAGIQKKGLLKKPSLLVLSTITRRLATLLSSGVTLIDSLSAVSSEQKGFWRDVIINIKDSVASGSSLARAMQNHADTFPDYYTGMIAAGESSGKLPDVLVKLAEFLETEINIKDRVRTALIYPSFTALVSVFVIIFLFTFVIPRITSVFESTSTSLPLITLVLIWISSGFKKFWWILLILVAGLAMAFKQIMKTRRRIIDSVLLKEPTGILMELYMLRFTLTMGFLLSGGLHILKAMQLTAKATGNAILEDRIREAENLVSQGARLSSSLEGFPPTLLQIIATGEQTGKLPEVLKKTAESSEADFDRKLQRAMSLLEPALILFMGLVVGFIVVAVLLPIFELNQIIR